MIKSYLPPLRSEWGVGWRELGTGEVEERGTGVSIQNKKINKAK